MIFQWNSTCIIFIVILIIIFSLDKENAHRERPSQTHVLFRKTTTSRPCLRKRRHPYFFKLTSSLFHFRILCSFWLYSLQNDNAIHSKIPVVSISNRSSISLFAFWSFLLLFSAKPFWHSGHEQDCKIDSIIATPLTTYLYQLNSIVISLIPVLISRLPVIRSIISHL